MPVCQLSHDDLSDLAGLVINLKISEVHVKYFAISLMTAMLLLIGCSKDKPTQSPAKQGTILSNRLVVSMVPGGSDVITITSTDGNGSFDPVTVTNSAPEIATVTISDSTLEITGITIGIANLTLANSSGASFALPVHVYDCHVLETDELLITYADTYSDLGPVAGVRLWRPYPPEGFFILGDFATNAVINQHEHAVMALKAKPGSDAIAFTHTYENSSGTVGHYFKRPVPPTGYVAMGTFHSFFGIPESTACIREDLTVMGDTGIVHGQYSSKFWTIDIPMGADAHSPAYLAPGSFVYNESTVPPRTDPIMRVLKIELPMLAEAPPQNYIPTLNSYDPPPLETVPRMAKAMLVPSSIINDLAHLGGEGVGWKVTNSPFYRLERQVYYKRQYHNHNQTSEIQTNSVLIRSGITTTESERIWNETSISISVEAGLSFKAFSGKVTATVSRTFGYETQTSVAELQEREVTSSINTHPGKAAALWQQYDRYILYRHNGTVLEPVSSWEFGIDSYVTDEYPDE
jgi:hypothetical protein